jgi:non-heme chloroperoxidase
MAGSGGLRFDALRLDGEEPPALVSYPARDGAALPVRHYPGPSRRHLILLHGSGSHSRYLAPLARAISAHGAAQVHTPDLRGHGVAPRRRGDVDAIDQLEEDVADLVGHIRTSDPEAAIAVGGHSSGGGLALRFAGGPHGGMACGFLLLAPFLAHDAPTTRRNAGGWARPKVARIVALSLLNALGIHALDRTVVIEFDMPEAYRDGTETLAYSHRLNRGLAPRRYEADLAAIRVPLLVLVGAEDEAFLADRYPETIRRSAPRAQVQLLPGVSHLGIVGAPETPPPVLEWLGRL